MTESAEHPDHPVGVDPPAVSRREVVRKGLIAAGIAAWTGPTVVSWAISPAHAVSPVPTDPPAVAANRPGAGATRPEELARTGTSLLPIAAGGVAAVGVGGVALRRARQQASPAPDHHQRSPRSDHDEPADQR